MISRRNSKRPRDEDEAELVNAELIPTGHKKARILPLRISQPTAEAASPQPYASSQDSFPACTIAPSCKEELFDLNDNDNVSLPSSASSLFHSSSWISTPSLLAESEHDMMIDSQPPSSPHMWDHDSLGSSLASSGVSPLISPTYQLPPAVDETQVNQLITGSHVTTSITGIFNSDVQMNTYDDLAGNPTSSFMAMSGQAFGNSLAVNRFGNQTSERIASPIREDDSLLPSPIFGQAGMMGRLNVGTNDEDELLRIHSTFGENSDLSVRNARVQRFAATGSENADGQGQKQEQSGTSGARRGRLKLAMGYRADCEKCKKHVPGHYSHWIAVD